MLIISCSLLIRAGVGPRFFFLFLTCLLPPFDAGKDLSAPREILFTLLETTSGGLETWPWRDNVVAVAAVRGSVLTRKPCVAALLTHTWRFMDWLEAWDDGLALQRSGPLEERDAQVMVRSSLEHGCKDLQTTAMRANMPRACNGHE